MSLQHQPQNKNKKFQNNNSILAIVNCCNWLDASPPSKSMERLFNSYLSQKKEKRNSATKFNCESDALHLVENNPGQPIIEHIITADSYCDRKICENSKKCLEWISF